MLATGRVFFAITDFEQRWCPVGFRESWRIQCASESGSRVMIGHMRAALLLAAKAEVIIRVLANLESNGGLAHQARQGPLRRSLFWPDLYPLRTTIRTIRRAFACFQTCEVRSCLFVFVPLISRLSQTQDYLLTLRDKVDHVLLVWSSDYALLVSILSRHILCGGSGGPSRSS